MNARTKTRAIHNGIFIISDEKLVDKLRPFIEGQIRRRMRRHAVTRNHIRREDVEDLVQEVFAVLFADNGRALVEHDPRAMDLSDWVCLIADRLTCSTLRSPRRNPGMLEPVDEKTLERYLEPVEPPTFQHHMQHANEVWNRAGPRLRTVLAKLLDGQKIADIPCSTGMSPDAVHQACSRLRKLAQSVTTSDKSRNS